MKSQPPPRQLEVLQLIAEGLLHKQIGEKLGIQRGTVHMHVVRMYSRTGAQTLAHLVAIGLRAGWIK